MKAIALVSAGIDSPVAAYMMMKQGVDIVALHMDNRPFTDDRETDKARELAGHLADICEKGKAAGTIADGVEFKAFMAPHGHAQEQFARHCNRHYACILCKRQMYRVAEAVAKRFGAVALVTGESLGQVASQTLQNLFVLSRTTSFPVWRPLIGFDKVEITRIAEESGTYVISSRPGMCCSAVPDKPTTKAQPEKLLEEEAKLVEPSVDDLVKKSVAGLEEIL